MPPPGQLFQQDLKVRMLYFCLRAILHTAICTSCQCKIQHEILSKDICLLESIKSGPGGFTPEYNFLMAEIRIADWLSSRGTKEEASKNKANLAGPSCSKSAKLAESSYSKLGGLDFYMHQHMRQFGQSSLVRVVPLDAALPQLSVRTEDFDCESQENSGAAECKTGSNVHPGEI